MEFEYTTIKALRDEDITVAELSDARARNLIRYVSQRINTLTSQWFQGQRLRTRVDGRGCSLAHLPDFIPIVKLDKLQVGTIEGSEFDVTREAYVLQPYSRPRVVELISSVVSGGGIALALKVPFLVQEGGIGGGAFPRTPQAVVLDGVFGWLESLKDVSAITQGGVLAVPAVPVVPPAEPDPPLVEVEVDTVTGFRVGDTLLFPGNMVAIIREVIGGPPPKLRFEAIDFAVPAGTKIENFGRVPLEIQRATILIINRTLRAIGSGSASDADLESRITSESVEGYSYSASAPGASGATRSGGPGAGENTSGDPEADDILSQFVAPDLYLGAA